MKFKQQSLLNLLIEKNTLNNNNDMSDQSEKKIKTQKDLLDPNLSKIKKYRKLKLVDLKPYSGTISEGYILKRKYIITDHYFIAEGLTHSDYTITWEGFDDHGAGKGKAVVDKNYQLHINAKDLNNANTTLLKDCLWIGGDTINKPNYAHWMFEHLLKLEIFRISGIDLSLPIIVSDRLPNTFFYWGELLIGQKLNWKKVDLTKPIKFKNLNITSCPAFRIKRDMMPTIWIEGFQKLRQRLIQLSHCYPKNKALTGKVLFLSRRSGSNWRRAINEEELFEIAKINHNAKFINISKYTPIEQIQLLYQADVLICFGGADGIACNFVNSKTKVFEILAPGHVAIYTAQIYCEINNIEYHRIYGSKFVTNQKGPHPLDRDYYVEPAEFCANLKSISSGKL